MYHDGNCCILFLIISIGKPRMKVYKYEKQIMEKEKTQLLYQSNFGILVTKLLLGGIEAGRP